MSENTKTGVITYMENDQVVDFYPTTKASSVVGLEELVKSLAGNASGESTSYTIRKDSTTGDMITEYSDGTKVVVHKNTDGSIVETTYKNNAVVKSVTTTKNADGSISVTPTSG